MLHHYLTIYTENGERYAEAWIQFDFIDWSWCFSRRRLEIKSHDGDRG